MYQKCQKTDYFLNFLKMSVFKGISKKSKKILINDQKKTKFVQFFEHFQRQFMIFLQFLKF